MAEHATAKGLAETQQERILALQQVIDDATSHSLRLRSLINIMMSSSELQTAPKCGHHVCIFSLCTIIRDEVEIIQKDLDEAEDHALKLLYPPREAKQ